jgi:hypothetical protein
MSTEFVLPNYTGTHLTHQEKGVCAHIDKELMQQTNKRAIHHHKLLLYNAYSCTKQKYPEFSSGTTGGNIHNHYAQW